MRDGSGFGAGRVYANRPGVTVGVNGSGVGVAYAAATADPVVASLAEATGAGDAEAVSNCGRGSPRRPERATGGSEVGSVEAPVGDAVADPPRGAIA